MTCGHLFDDGTEEAVLFFKPGLIFGKKLVKVMEQHPVEHGAFGMPVCVPRTGRSGAMGDRSLPQQEPRIKKWANPLRKRLIAERTQVSGITNSKRNLKEVDMTHGSPLDMTINALHFLTT